jgi:hypothetical protein
VYGYFAYGWLNTRVLVVGVFAADLRFGFGVLLHYTFNTFTFHVALYAHAERPLIAIGTTNRLHTLQYIRGDTSTFYMYYYIYEPHGFRQRPGIFADS